MFDRRRYLNTFAVLSLVLLRLVIGWHFFREGTQKVEYDHHDGRLRLAFSAEGFLKGAKGPMSDWYHAQAPDDHGWRQHLATPRQSVPKDDQELAHQAWYAQIADDWRAILDEVHKLPSISEEQEQMAEAALNSRLQQLANYLAGEAEAIAEYRHELWRLENLRDAPEAGAVPFVDERIAAKEAETSSQPNVWLREVHAMDLQYRDDLRKVLAVPDNEQHAAATSDVVEAALREPREERLEMINLAVTVLTIAVGVCLLLGLFTRLASIAGALFLLGVIASQPPWFHDTIPTMPNVIEFAGLLVVAGSGAGRWLGLDFFMYALFNRFGRRDEITI
jgi:uncharacterized membrane protein YphA (DoxX/SURF4 family)